MIWIFIINFPWLRSTENFVVNYLYLNFILHIFSKPYGIGMRTYPVKFYGEVWSIIFWLPNILKVVFKVVMTQKSNIHFLVSRCVPQKNKPSLRLFRTIGILIKMCSQCSVSHVHVQERLEEGLEIFTKNT